MTGTRFSVGVILAGVALVPVVIGSHGVCRRFLGSYERMERSLASAIVALSAIAVVCEVLGTFGYFRVWAVVPTLALLGATGAYWCNRPTLASVTGPDSRNRVGEVSLQKPGVADSAPTWQKLVAGFVVAIVAGSWISRVHHAYRLGMGIVSVDTQWYHLPAAVRFVQTGHLLPIQYFDVDAVTAFFPFTSELYHGFGMMLFGSDIASLAINLGWLALLLVAAWSIGRQFGVGPTTCIGAALVMGLPGLVATQPGAALTDVVGLALLLSAVALFIAKLDSRRSLACDAVIGLALGLAIGVKFTFVGPAVFIAVAVCATAEKRQRLTRCVLILGAACVTGSYWYLRNVIQVGSPLPPLHVALGPVTLPSLHVNTRASTLSQYLFDMSNWRVYFIPGFRAVLGPVWPAIVLVVLVACLAGFARHVHRRVRILPVLVALNVVYFVFTPQYLSVGNQPYFFQFNLRYVTPALLIACVALPVLASSFRKPLFVMFVVIAVVTQLDPTSWPDHIGWEVFQDRVSMVDARWGIAGFALILVVWSVWTAWPTRFFVTRRVGSWGLSIAVAVATLLGIARPSYVRNWYSAKPGTQGSTAIQPLIAWSHSVHHARILLSPQPFVLQYPFVNRDLSNRVQVPTVLRGRVVGSPRTCDEWARVVRSGRYDFVAFYGVGSNLGGAESMANWVRRQPTGRLVKGAPFRAGQFSGWAYHLDPDRLVCNGKPVPS